MISESKNNFSSVDQSILKLGVSKLPNLEREIVICRFWKNQTIEEIAFFLNLEWSQVSSFMENALKNLRAFCQEHISKNKEDLCQN